MTEKKRIQTILDRLDAEYGTEYRIYLEHSSPWELLMAVIMSAQCTDARVNLVTPGLFAAYPTPEALGNAEQEDVERLIHSVGFFHNKAKNLIACSREIAVRYGGVVPATIEELTALPGVGRKTANVIRGHIYDEPSIVVDTHVKRISNRLGLTKEQDPVKIEFDLMKVLPKDHWILWNLDIIALGRTICLARNPKCEQCFLEDCCPAVKTNRRNG